MVDVALNPAEQAAEEALNRMYACIDGGKSFLLEAGAGAGKTYSLIKALKYLIEKRGSELLRKHQQVACISYTNVASNEIASRIDCHPAIHSSTIHSFCWLIIKDFQPYLRLQLPNIDAWSEKLKESGGVGTRKINYDEFGHRKIDDDQISLHHDDVLTLTVDLMKQDKFRELFVSRYPVLLIDEYQDTDKGFAEVLKSHVLAQGKGPLIGFFGDHWQKIYDSVCGKVEHSSLEVIDKKANFRSVPVIVGCLNRMRPELTQYAKDPEAQGSVGVYHTNNWMGERLKGQHWDGDLPSEVSHDHLNRLIKRLTDEGWDFELGKTKILMLTHKVLASEQGYSNLAKAFKRNESFIKKEHPHISFLVDTVEPVCTAYKNKRFGEMFAVQGRRTPIVCSHGDKVGWSKDMDALLELRSASTIGFVIDHLKRTNRPVVPESVERRERELERPVESQGNEDLISRIDILKALRSVSYQEIIALTQFINEETPFATKHGVKGAEFENVLVVFGRGWNQYNFNQFLEWTGSPGQISVDKRDAYERNRNLFYVTCSRPKKRLALLFTQKLSTGALATLAKWFGRDAVHALS